ncbi:hypothetical protein [Cesiribacter andamanensis]|uniref:Uncharacterized protein n=1 Tax=Cesiribacter andamanensis AMV16 TaxID=1279009 RepID=M7MX73_9BACT|nr:hypothetical protein [Cesiribacter andamanensis]EMR01033.1 hypothetical protein ADICEAN_03845 [Cesiribacter andamanensis AMV16]
MVACTSIPLKCRGDSPTKAFLFQRFRTFAGGLIETNAFEYFVVVVLHDVFQFV